MPYTDGYWWSNDGLRLHYRDYPGPPDRAALLCLPGLTRNARDFAELAERMSPARRVIAVEFRGRGDSAYATDPMSYVSLTYMHDVAWLLDELGLARFVAVGTSLGGLVAMLLASGGAERFAGVVLNDIGPTIERSGLERIRGAVGRLTWPTWTHAARALAETNRDVHPGFALRDWIAMAKRLCRLTPQGRIVPDYDKRIAEAFRLPTGDAGGGGGGGIDMWAALDALRDVPTVIVRGERSDVLSAATAQAMLARLADATLATVPDVGHAPTLDEPVAVAAIDALLARTH